MSTTLAAHKIRKIFIEGETSHLVLDNITATFNKGTSYAIQGVSGCGKSTLLHVLSGLEPPTSGEVLYNNHDLTRFQSNQRSNFLNRKLGFVFQSHYLISELSVLENVAMVGLISGLSKHKAETNAKALLTFLGLEHRINYQPNLLSGGEQQRVSIARALFNKPEFILADEPTGSLDSVSAKSVMELFLRCQSEWGLGLIVCSHDEAICNGMDRLYQLNQGMLACKR